MSSSLTNFTSNSRKEDQLKALLLSNTHVFKLWGYYTLAKKIYDKVLAGTIIDEFDTVAPTATGPFRPPQWKNLPTDVSQLVLVKTNIGGYFFDAFLREEHTSTLKITEHPVQTGANITDHSFVQPATLSLEIGMSDAMDSLVKNQFNITDMPTKSVAAYRVLQELQEARIPVSVHTRIRDYDNMLIEEITVPDDYKSLYGLRCTVNLKEIFVVDVGITTVSAREQTTGTTAGGQKQADTDDSGTVASQIEAATGGTS